MATFEEKISPPVSHTLSLTQETHPPHSEAAAQDHGGRVFTTGPPVEERPLEH
jgi:hypothetical protein